MVKLKDRKGFTQTEDTTDANALEGIPARLGKGGKDMRWD